MSNLIEKAKIEIDRIVREAFARAVQKGELPAGEIAGSVEMPKNTENGDYAANHAMSSAKALRMPPRKIAEVISAHLKLSDSYFRKVEAAGPGVRKEH